VLSLAITVLFGAVGVIVARVSVLIDSLDHQTAR
jgi:hypothetical protein